MLRGFLHAGDAYTGSNLGSSSQMLEEENDNLAEQLTDKVKALKKVTLYIFHLLFALFIINDCVLLLQTWSTSSLNCCFPFILLTQCNTLIFDTLNTMNFKCCIFSNESFNFQFPSAVFVNKRWLLQYFLFVKVTIDIGNVVREQNDLIGNMVSKEFILFFRVQHAFRKFKISSV